MYETPYLVDSSKIPDFLSSLFALCILAPSAKNFKYDSSAPIRPATSITPLICGQEYFGTVADALEAAKERIMITDFQLSPCTSLKRPWSGEKQAFIPDPYWRLDAVLK